HPGMPLGMADVATVLFRDILKYDPSQPKWADRDRFILSAGHGSMLQYALLYLAGYEDMKLEDLRNFRQLGAKTAGHPEYGHATGIETTTGPLGQGFANAVGMALAERHLAAEFGDDIVNHHTYVIAGDGCLMEGISHEAASMAGHLKLSRLIVLFDDNGISIDGPTSLSVSEDTPGRFRALGWDVQEVDGHDEAAVHKAILAAQKTDTPSLIACKTTIGFGAPTKAGKSSSHGSPLGKDEIAGTRSNIGWAHEPFHIPEEVLNAWREAGARGQETRAAWEKRLNALDADKAAEFNRRIEGKLPEGWQGVVNNLKEHLSEKKPSEATRKSSQNVLEVLNIAIPEMLGGSADLTGSNNTKTATLNGIQAGNYGGRYVYYGVREHAMASAMNGIALHGGVIPYGGTFLVFTDYCRPAIRLSALMEQRVIYVMTHDSIGLGEDGPTHQPVEHVAALRAIPNLLVFRPADAVETAECWALALQAEKTPSVLALTRQNLPTLRTTHTKENLSGKGGYVISPAEGNARVTLLATGSEVSLAVEAQGMLKAQGISAKVVSLPSWELFEKQPRAYREEVLGKDTLKVAIEAAAKFGWERYIGTDGIFVGMPGFGASGPAEELYAHFGITAHVVVEKVTAALRGQE
ncbi:MAG: transketolase, partial [Alphaproteobacteria bacterium]|nr:transketolase [Alphaproteobacteria bacterium]